jgi:hypothetical protein
MKHIHLFQSKLNIGTKTNLKMAPRTTRTKYSLQQWLTLALFCTPVLSNVEKTIFLGPASIPIPQAHPTLEDLHIDVLTPNNSSLRTHLEAQFPPDPTLKPSYLGGKATWLLLDNLEPNRRYEVRICWPATVCSVSQPPYPPIARRLLT